MSENNGHNKTAAERLRELAAKQEMPVVEVTPKGEGASGFTYKFYKPKKFQRIFALSELPSSITNEAVKGWEEDGTLKQANGGGEAVISEDQLKIMETMADICQRTIDLSVDPKFVRGAAQSANEISTDEVPDADLEYLFHWVNAGGDDAAAFALFRKGRQSNALASASRRKVRSASK